MIVRGSLKVLAVGALFTLGAYSNAFAAKGSHSGNSHAVSSQGGTSHIASNAREGRHGRGGISGVFFAEATRGHLGGSHRGHASRFAGVASDDYAGHSGGGIQCVTFARADSGIELSGNANTWWNHAEGVYARGSRPEPGSVLNFRANGSMHMGHVAVVNEVVDSRTVAIDHANWGGPGAVRGGISRDITVVDVSPSNDWSAVRVGLGHSGEFGSIYPTYGFIYNRPDSGVMVAANDGRAPIPALNPAPRDLRGSVRETPSYDEVAEAPDVADAFPRFGHYSRRHGTAANGHLVSFRTVSFRTVGTHSTAGRIAGGRAAVAHAGAAPSRTGASHVSIAAATHHHGGRHSRA